MQWPDEESNSSAPVAEQYQQSSCGVSFASMFFICLFFNVIAKTGFKLGVKKSEGDRVTYRKTPPII